MPRRSSATARTSPRPDQHRHGRQQERGELAEQLAPAARQVHRAGQQEDEEHQAEQVAVPLDAAGQVGPALPGGEMVLLVLAAGNQRPPVHPQDLDAAEAPPVPLALERLEGQRHDAAPPGLVDVQPVPASPQQPQRDLGVLGDAPLIPAAQFVQRDPADQPHGAGEDRPVVLVARGLRHGEEVLVGVVQPPVVAGCFPVAVVLRATGRSRSRGRRTAGAQRRRNPGSS